MMVTGNLYMGMGNAIARAAEQFNRYECGPIVRKRTLLIGNMFQAGEWARDSKRGVPIIYTDNAGQRHRAVEVEGSGLFREQVRFPLRLFDRNSIVQFVERLYSRPEAEENTRIVPGHDSNMHFLFTSFKGVLAAQRSEQNRAPDRMIIDTRANAIGWMVDKEEKERIRRALRNAVKADQKDWLEEHPDEPYPVNFATSAGRAASKSQKQIMLTIKIPETEKGRARFMDLFVKALGLQLFIPDNLASRAVTVAREIERERYERLANPALEERKRAQDAREQRQKMRQMLTTAFQKSDVTLVEPDPAATVSMVSPPEAEKVYHEVKNSNNIMLDNVHILSGEAQNKNAVRQSEEPSLLTSDEDDFVQKYQGMGGR